MKRRWRCSVTDYPALNRMLCNVLESRIERLTLKRENTKNAFVNSANWFLSSERGPEVWVWRYHEDVPYRNTHRHLVWVCVPEIM